MANILLSSCLHPSMTTLPLSAYSMKASSTLHVGVPKFEDTTIISTLWSMIAMVASRASFHNKWSVYHFRHSLL